MNDIASTTVAPSVAFDQISYDVRDGVAVIAFDRPDKANAVTRTMQDSYAAAMTHSDTDPAVRAIVVTGNGKAFCAGADLELLEGDVLANIGDVRASVRAVLSARYVTKPVIAAINGGTAGMGFSLAIAADVRLAAAGAKLSTSFAQRGLVAEYGTSWLLPRLVGLGRSLDLLLSARMITAEQALEYGLVQEVYPREDLLAAATDYARTLATTCAPLSMAVIKRQVLHGLDQPLAGDIELALREMPPSWQRPDLREGVQAFREGRAPRFAPLDAALVPPEPES